jgi:hypothetical protein
LSFQLGLLFFKPCLSLAARLVLAIVQKRLLDPSLADIGADTAKPPEKIGNLMRRQATTEKGEPRVAKPKAHPIVHPFLSHTDFASAASRFPSPSPSPDPCSYVKLKLSHWHNPILIRHPSLP